VLRQTLSYAGDARVMDLQPNEGRLLSYAIDLGTEVKPGAAADGGRLTHLKGIKGVLYTTTKLRETKTYAVRDRNPQGRAVPIGHPVKDQFQLAVTTMLVQAARDAYRFEVKVPAAETAKQAVTEERNVGSSTPLTDSPTSSCKVPGRGPEGQAQPLDAPRALVPALKLQLSPSRGGGRQARRGLPVNETTEWRAECTPNRPGSAARFGVHSRPGRICSKCAQYYK
jgi:hypothetical protein